MMARVTVLGGVSHSIMGRVWRGVHDPYPRFPDKTCRDCTICWQHLLGIHHEPHTMPRSWWLLPQVRWELDVDHAVWHTGALKPI
jgi:hypothetical protein